MSKSDGYFAFALLFAILSRVSRHDGPSWFTVACMVFMVLFALLSFVEMWLERRR